MRQTFDPATLTFLRDQTKICQTPNARFDLVLSSQIATKMANRTDTFRDL